MLIIHRLCIKGQQENWSPTFHMTGKNYCDSCMLFEHCIRQVCSVFGVDVCGSVDSQQIEIDWYRSGVGQRHLVYSKMNLCCDVHQIEAIKCYRWPSLMFTWTNLMHNTWALITLVCLFEHLRALCSCLCDVMHHHSPCVLRCIGNITRSLVISGHSKSTLAKAASLPVNITGTLY